MQEQKLKKQREELNKAKGNPPAPPPVPPVSSVPLLPKTPVEDDLLSQVSERDLGSQKDIAVPDSPPFVSMDEVLRPTPPNNDDLLSVCEGDM
jgi:hypothetical protein